MNYMSEVVNICASNLSVQHKQYMLDRGFSASILDEFQIGTFNKELIKRRIPLEVLRDKKIMFKNKHGKFWSDFDDRIIIPIMDHCGEPVGITGRIVEESDRAKYYNSDYSKSCTLFGLDKAKRHIIEQNVVMVVEGNLDVLAAFDCGVRNVVAICGVAMTKQHIHLLLRYCDRVVLAFDSDAAGLAATFRSKVLLDYYLQHDMLKLQYFEYPEEVKDVGDLMVRLGKEGARKVLNDGMMPIQISNPDQVMNGWEWTIE